MREAGRSISASRSHLHAVSSPDKSRYVPVSAIDSSPYLIVESGYEFLADLHETMSAFAEADAEWWEPEK